MMVETRLQEHKNILVVEDDESIRETLKFVLEMEGFLVRTATNGREAIGLLSQDSPPALIILDLMMPVMNGLEFMETTESDPRISPIPIVVLTAFAEKAKPSRANRVLKKPVDVEVLLNVVRQYCAK